MENPGLFIRIANRVGQPIEKLQSKLPQKVQTSLHDITRKSIEQALKVALKTIPPEKISVGMATAEKTAEKKGRAHVIGSAITGSIGGLFGLPAMIVELPITTATMLRSIAENARAFGFDLNDPRVQLECLTVFALGGASQSDDASETTYYAARIGFSEVTKAAAHFVAKHTAKEILESVERGAAPALVRFVTAVAARFEVTVSRKLLTSAIPIVGAAGGAMINSVFMRHFSQVAKYHFGLRRLEELHGESAVQELYRSSL